MYIYLHAQIPQIPPVCLSVVCLCVSSNTCSYQTLILCLLHRQPVSCIYVVSRSLFAFYFSRAPLFPVLECQQKRDDVDSPLVCLCLSATPVLVSWKERDEGSLGKVLQIRSNYFSPPPSALCDMISPAPQNH